MNLPVPESGQGYELSEGQLITVGLRERGTS